MKGAAYEGVLPQDRSLPEPDGIWIRNSSSGSARAGAAVSAVMAAPENGHGLEENTAAPPRRLLTAMRLRAVGPGAKGVRDGEKAARLFQRLRADPEVWLGQQGSQIVRAFFVYRYYYYPVYYLGDSNLLWSEEAERMFLDRVASSPLGYGRTCGSSILLGDKWDLIENLMAQGVNPRSRLIHFSKNSSFHYFTVDEMGLRLMKLALDEMALDEMALYRFQRYLQQNGICKASMLPLYLFSLELLSEAYALKKGSLIEAHCFRARQML